MSKKKAVKALESVSEKFQAALEQARKNQEVIMEDPNLNNSSGWLKTATQIKSPIPGLEAGLEIIKDSIQELSSV